MLAMVQDSELDRGTTGVAPGTERMCALTRKVLPVDQLIRFVVSPAGEVVPDVKRKLPGRGLWITGTRAAVAEAVKRNVFARGFRRELRVPGDLAQATARLLDRAAFDALAIAGKAGRVVTGAAKVEAAFGREDLVALIDAAEASTDGKRKLAATRHRSRSEKAQEVEVFEIFAGEQLDLALNRPNVVHAALLAGPGAETFLARARCCARFRTEN